TFLPYDLPGSSSFSGANVTDAFGNVVFNIGGRDVKFQFLDEVNGSALQGLSVGFALDNVTKDQGVLLVIDPQDRFPPYTIALQGPESGRVASDFNLSRKALPVVGTVSLAGEGDSSDGSTLPINLVRVFLPNGPATPQGRVILEQLPARVSNFLDITNVAVVAAKALDAAGVPLGKYAGKIGGSSTRTMTQDEAWAEIQGDVRDKVSETVFFFVQPEVLATAEINLPTPQGLALDVLGFGFDANAVYNCGLPSQRITVTKAGPLKFFACKDVTMQDLVKGLVRASVDGVDEFGKPLSKGSLELVSTTGVPLAFKVPFDGNSIELSVPTGNYRVRVVSPGFTPENKTVEVPEVGASVRITLKPYHFGTQPQELMFSPPATLPLASVGVEYFYSFCKPDRTLASDLCGSSVFPSTDPVGGSAPYHFQIDSGFLPFGLSLNLNGLVTGTPTVAGTSVFSVCAVDLQASQVCEEVELEVSARFTVSVSKAGAGTGTVSSDVGSI
ncbi:MAG TPA: putative Ig domain-containing protein, partial [archaeon]|nr:putative Ig domain-containing protein [archaeon]